MKITLESITKFCKKNQISYRHYDVYCTWSTGGVSGGNCWNDGDYYPNYGEPEPEFEDFNKIVEELFPNITYLQYKKLARELIKCDTYTELQLPFLEECIIQ